MSDPSGYTVSYSFGNFQANSPTSPLPALPLDNELANISTAIDGLVDSVKDVRRSDGALQNGIVTWDSLALALQLIFDPTDGQAVADAVAAAQAAATAASGSATAAGTSATNAAGSAAAAAASAASVNLSLYLSKAGNLAGIGAPDTARANIQAAKVDGSDMVGRLAPHASANSVADCNLLTTSGWAVVAAGANMPPGFASWVIETVTFSDLYISQRAYPYAQAAAGTSAVTAFRRYSYDNGSGTILWTAWESAASTAIGSIAWFPAVNAPAGYIKADGSLVARATYPGLYAFAAGSGNFITEALWPANNGAFSSGDLTTTFRVPDLRGEFIRALDNGRGVDPARSIGSFQGDLLKDHTHNYQEWNGAPHQDGTNAATVQNLRTTSTTGGVNGGLGGAETRPRNVALLACIKT
ncbi:tail fiber protein [Bradyrhizobium sp.]|jgi:hypothetical protein|uniref:tail fiber protein n=1 Tax=Bradyrhizobium sp. TaxID=376 RepID=UPI002DDCAE91|nr:tail fiber protein [Bradyrhizobium sp.]HEV2155419.1 tail fiber protein [Bradyrhizobium sp.]